MSAMIYGMPQGSDDWHEARRGIPTASCFKQIFSKDVRKTRVADYRLALGDKPLTYQAQIIAERIEAPDNGFSNSWTDRGHEMEPEAIETYEFITGSKVDQVGIVFKDAAFNVAASPDGLVGQDGGVEVKSLMLANHIKHLLVQAVPDEHIMQCHGCLWVTGRKWWDFIGYHPSAKILIVRVERDESIMAMFDHEIAEYLNDLEIASAFVMG